MLRLLTGGNVRTLDHARHRRRGGRAATATASSPSARTARSWRSAGRREDLAGRTVIPGLIDAHNHLQMTGRGARPGAAVRLPLDRRDRRARGGAVRARCRRARGCSGAAGTRACWPSAGIRRATTSTPSRPTIRCCSSASGTSSSCNGAALRAAGVTRDTPDPAGTLYAGSFERDDDGHPTGLFRDRAKELIWRCIPEPTEVDWVTAIETACREYNRVGLTAVCEPGLSPDADPRATSRRSARGRAVGARRHDDGRLGLRHRRRGGGAARAARGRSARRPASAATGCGWAASSSCPTAASATAPRASSSRTWPSRAAAARG